MVGGEIENKVKFRSISVEAELIKYLESYPKAIIDEQCTSCASIYMVQNDSKVKGGHKKNCGRFVSAGNLDTE